MEWHIITGEYPPASGGVSDYTYLLVRSLSDAGENVHVWAPKASSELRHTAGVEVHELPAGFGLRWLGVLNRGLSWRSNSERTLLVQYVPHMYGWKSMNLLFCAWLALRGRKDRLWTMFHEVAFPFRRNQPWKHHLLAAVHRLMAWIVLQASEKSFTSIEPYRTLLRQIRPKARIGLLRLFSNLPFGGGSIARARTSSISARAIVGMFSSFGRETCALLEDALPVLLKDPRFDLLLIGPGEHFLSDFCGRFPQYRRRLSTTGRLSALEAAPHLERCDALLQLYPEGASGARGTFVAALGSGIPVVTTAGAQTEALLRTRGAIAFAHHEPEGIREVLDGLVSDKAAARKIGEAGRRLYEAHFALENTIEILTGRPARATTYRARTASAR